MSSVFEKKRALDEQIELTKELNEQLEHALEIVTQNPNVIDGIQLASEMGRLDIVSLVLGLLTLILGLVALCGFWMIRGSALEAACEAARIEINQKAPEMFNEVWKLNGEGNQQPMSSVSDVKSKNIIAQATEVERDE